MFSSVLWQMPGNESFETLNLSLILEKGRFFLEETI
jgi:hypothetical protein